MVFLAAPMMIIVVFDKIEVGVAEAFATHHLRFDIEAASFRRKRRWHIDVQSAISVSLLYIRFGEKDFQNLEKNSTTF